MLFRVAIESVFFVFEMNLGNASAEAWRITSQYTVGNSLLDGERTVLGLYKTALRQHVAADTKDCEASLVDKVAIDTKVRKFWEAMHARLIRFRRFWTTR